MGLNVNLMENEMEIKITFPDGDSKSVYPSDIAEHYATETCKKYGWDVRCAAWYEISKVEKSSKKFLKEHAEKMFPDSTIEIVL